MLLQIFHVHEEKFSKLSRSKLEYVLLMKESDLGNWNDSGKDLEISDVPRGTLEEYSN